MSRPPLRIALVRGPMYDHLYDLVTDGDIPVEIVVHADHPTLNREVAELLAAGERLDVISTHSKYAPSQSRWLRPLDALVAAETISRLAPLAVELCRFEGRAYCLPRLIDVRILWARTDRLDVVPDTWAAFAESAAVFGFPGRESGLFGTFFELVVGAGGALFAADGTPTMRTAEAELAVDTLRRLAARAPRDLPDWHYDEVDRALLDGRVDAAGAWPGAWGAIRSTPVSSDLEPFPYPAGPLRRVSYSGCHAWAIPTTCGDVDGAVQLVETLLAEDGQALDARGGNICAHEAALRKVEPVDDVDRRRLEVTRRTIAESMITYPSLSRFPEIEDAGWSAIRDVLRGTRETAEALRSLQETAERVLA